MDDDPDKSPGDRGGTAKGRLMVWIPVLELFCLTLPLVGEDDTSPVALAAGLCLWYLHTIGT
ncbi:hypothetical protein IU470_30290 [Nocardia abscessus]|uniref:Uncharacterized protein n=1 Tax=Nocardia abscessus TaxID=120957 RepID=A0ABS0CIL8_9NOCA|nr:hypothetical protein [Nocardia abscessus]MBF6229368.1 hypothetical protein [Nocardia abscessus]